jgi:hypothetical protein
MSGVSCALAASRQGAKVILVQDRPVLGGNASSEIRMHIMGGNSYRPNKDLELEARESGIIEEIRLENAFRNPQRSPSMFDFILYEKCRAEPGLTLLLDTAVIKADVQGDRITRIEALRTSTEDGFLVEAEIFVDCTGDGVLGALAGAAFMRGREDQAAFRETLALEEADTKTLGSTLLLMGRKHDRPMTFIPPPWARKFTEADLHLRKHATPEIDSGLEYGFWWMEWGGHLDTLKQNDAIRDELLAIVMGVWDHIKNTGDHGAECWALDWFGAVPGKRESRRFIGQYVLSEHDLLSEVVHEDAIAYGGWSIDLHPPEGVDRPEEPPCVNTFVLYLYDIPLRCCVGRDLENLMFAGRNISATHVAFASTRVMATCALMGEGVGVAAAYGVREKLPPSRLAADPKAIHAIRQELLRQDVYLVGAEYEGRGDLAHLATVRASSSTSQGPPENVLSGQTRSLRGEKSVSPSREVPGTHRWMSDPLKGFPASLTLSWDEPVSLDEIEIVFDSGLHRPLTLTQSDAFWKQMVWGSGQPECVKDYRLEVSIDDQWSEIALVRDNWQRRNRHLLSGSPQCKALRITVEETWGLDHARIHRILCFSKKY